MSEKKNHLLFNFNNYFIFNNSLFNIFIYIFKEFPRKKNYMCFTLLFGVSCLFYRNIILTIRQNFVKIYEKIMQEIKIEILDEEYSKIAFN